MNRSREPTGASPAAPGWRLLAAIYDLLPVLALWMLLSALVLLARGNTPLLPFSAGQLLLWAGCWSVAGGYFVASWRRGGQTLGMRPWRLRVCLPDGSAASVPALLLRYTVATVSLALFGAGFLWAFFDSQRRAWHDLAAGTVMLRLPRREA